MKSLHWMICVALTACGGDAVSTSVGNHPTPPPKDTTTTTPAAKPGSPRSATVIGDPITGTVASAVNVSLKVVDSIGVPVPGAIVNFVVTAGGGSVFAPAVATSTLGVANQQWTLGTKAGAQTIEARWIDPQSGALRVLGSVAVTAGAGPITKLIARDSTMYLGTVFSATRLLSAQDQYANAIASPVANVSVGAGWLVRGDSVQAPSAESATKMTVTAGAAQASATLLSVVDLRKYTWTVSWSCTYIFPFSFNGLPLDSTASTMVVDSTRAASDPGPRRGPPLGWGPYIMYASGTTTHYPHGAPPIVVHDIRDIAIQRQTSDTISFSVVNAIGVDQTPGDGTLPSAPVPGGFMNTSGHLQRIARPAQSYSSAGLNQLASACMGKDQYALHPMTLEGR